MSRRLLAVAVLALVGWSQAVFAQTPSLSSRPGAAYTLYLNFDGFTYTGTWNGATPGTVAAYTGTTAQKTEVWARTAEKYAAFNVNVTTVDPAIAAGQGGSDTARQAYYTTTARVMHSVVTPTSAWYGSAGGVSYIGTWQSGYSNSGTNSQLKTNWTFSNNLGSPKNVAEAAAHENGHAIGLNHQSRWTAGTPPTLSAEYDNGQTTGGSSGSYFISPTMGVGYNARRSTWRHGAISNNSSNTAQNDVAVIQAQSGIRYSNTATNTTGFFDAGIGRSVATATALPLSGNTINSTLAKGVITPLSSTSPNPIGTDNYTKDYFTFTVANGVVGNLNASLKSGYFTNNSGTTENPGWTLNATLRLLASDGVTQLGISNSSDYLENITINSLASGTYYLEVSSAGGFTDSYGNKYYDMGGYTLLGSFTPVPEPGAMLAVVLVVFAAGGCVRRFRRPATAEPTAAA